MSRRAAPRIKSVQDFVRVQAQRARDMAMEGAPGCKTEAGACAICAEDNVEVIVQEGCEHRDAATCKACMANYLRERLEDIESFPVKCPMHASGCLQTISFQTADLVLEDRSEKVESAAQRAAAIEHDKAKFLQFHLTKTVGYIVSCPVCETLVIAENEADLHGQAVRCGNSGCGKRFCVDCEVEWHQGLTCSQYKGTEVDPATQDLLNQGKRCPGCGEGIIHYLFHECHHIRPDGGCPTCHHHFCYVCLGSYYSQPDCRRKGCTSPACLSDNLPRCTPQTCAFSGSSFCRDGPDGCGGVSSKVCP